MIDLSTIVSLSTRLLTEEAQRRSIAAAHLNAYRTGSAFVELAHGDHREYIYEQKWGSVPEHAIVAVNDKHIAKSFLARNDVRICDGDVFGAPEIARAVRYAESIGFPVVIKPLDSAHGYGVRTNIPNSRELATALEHLFNLVPYCMVEHMFTGKEYRLFATRDTFVAATERVPANVVGDGVHTIDKLIGIKNNDPRRGDSSYGHALLKIVVDEAVRVYLRESRYTLETVPAHGEQVFLRSNSNLSTGGDSIDRTDEVHPAFHEIAVRAVRAIPGLPYGGVDVMTSAPIAEKPDYHTYVVIEINASPMISMHHFPYEGMPRDVARVIIDCMFPETSGR